MANLKTLKMANTLSSADALTILKEAIAYYKTREVEQTKEKRYGPSVMSSSWH